MKKLTLLLSATALAAVLAVPSGAYAARGVGGGANCGYTSVANGNEVSTEDGNPATNDPLVVYADTNGGGGTSGEQDAAVGACMNTNTTAADFEGGSLEAGVGNPTNVGPGVGGPAGAYVIADGDDDNVDDGAENSTKGYIGVSNFETQPLSGDRCEVPPAGSDNNAFADTGAGTNSGGCLTIRQDAAPPAGNKNTIAVVPGFPLLACGNDSSGPPNDRRWENSTRDGCTLPS